MKRSLMVISVFALLSATSALAENEFDPAALPHDKAALLEVNDVQLRMLNKAVRFCDDLGRSKHSANFCVTSAIDLDVRQSGDETLKAFHWTLLPNVRYDDKRSMVDLERVLNVKD